MLAQTGQSLSWKFVIQEWPKHSVPIKGSIPVVPAVFTSINTAVLPVSLYQRIQLDTHLPMYTIPRTELFDRWLSRLKDARGTARIVKRIRSAERGNIGDCLPVGDGVMEMRIHSGPGYRVYYTPTGEVVYVLLCGGSKRGQRSDIARAIALQKKSKGNK